MIVEMIANSEGDDETGSEENIRPLTTPGLRQRLRRIASFLRALRINILDSTWTGRSQ
jgi:hypothetical protein